MSQSFQPNPFIFHGLHNGGKIAVAPSQFMSADDLKLAYTPGVAQPCLMIEKHPETARTLTTKGNMVAVISNGTAVLGLGDIGALAGKPVMEGKALLFKLFADINSIDLNIEEKDPTKLIEIIKSLSCGFGAINLEDIKAPECFVIEKTLCEQLNIPVFHDDQHGTAVVTAAGFLNALKLAEKKIEDAKCVVSGAGAAAIASIDFLCSFGLQQKHVWMFDSKGLIHTGRTDLTHDKKRYAQHIDSKTNTDLLSIIKDKDAFIGVSVSNMLTPAMVAAMANKPIIFAMANPTPEILPHVAHSVRDDVLMATGRSDFDNQINNVLCFPYIFRAALDVNAPHITLKMKQAAALALAEVAQLPHTTQLHQAYGVLNTFGPKHFMPKVFDRRLCIEVPYAVAKAALEEGVARSPICLESYRRELHDRFHPSITPLLRDVRDTLLADEMHGDGSALSHNGADQNVHFSIEMPTALKNDALLLCNDDSVSEGIKFSMPTSHSDSVKKFDNEKARHATQITLSFLEQTQQQDIKKDSHLSATIPNLQEKATQECMRVAQDPRYPHRLALILCNAAMADEFTSMESIHATSWWQQHEKWMVKLAHTLKAQHEKKESDFLKSLPIEIEENIKKTQETVRIMGVQHDTYATRHKTCPKNPPKNDGEALWEIATGSFITMYNDWQPCEHLGIFICRTPSETELIYNYLCAPRSLCASHIQGVETYRFGAAQQYAHKTSALLPMALWMHIIHLLHKKP